MCVTSGGAPGRDTRGLCNHSGNDDQNSRPGHTTVRLDHDRERYSLTEE